MSSDALSERGKVLEEIFFAEREQQRIAALKERAATESAAEGLAEATHIDDGEVLKRVAELGVSTDTLAAFSIVPMLFIAWGDKVLDNAERDAIMVEAVSAGIESGTPAYELLSSWLTRTPQPELFEAWRAFHAELAPHLSERERSALKEDIVAKARRVARASGGFLGLGSVSADEAAALKKLEELLA